MVGQHSFEDSVIDNTKVFGTLDLGLNPGPQTKWLHICYNITMSKYTEETKQKIRDWRLKHNLLDLPNCKCYVHNKTYGKLRHNENCECPFCKGRKNHKENCRCAWHGESIGRFKKGDRKYKETLEEILVNNGNKRSGKGQAIKKRLIVEGLLKDVCVSCGLFPYWNNRKITLQLDHIDGNRGNWELKNLRVLCPNCHTQTDNFTWRYNYENKNI